MRSMPDIESIITEIPPANTTAGSGQSKQSEVNVRAVDGKTWDDIVVGFKDVIHEQTSCFNELRWKPEQLEKLVVYSGTQVLGGAVVRKVNVPLTPKTLAIIRWGPVWRKFGVIDDIGTMRIVYKAIADQLTINENCFILFIPSADPQYSQAETDILTDLGCTPGFQPESTERYFVNVGEDLDQIRASLGQKWRYNLKKAEKNGLKTEFVSGPEGLSQFQELYSSMVERKKFLETSPIETLHSLMELAQEELRPEIVIVKKDGIPVAGAVVDCSGEQAMYLYGATNHMALGLKAGYVMQWEIIKFLSKLPHIKWYNLGGGTSETCSLHQFKRGLVGKSGVIAMEPAYFHLAKSVSTNLLGSLAVSMQLTKGRLQKSIHETLAAFA